MGFRIFLNDNLILREFIKVYFLPPDNINIFTKDGMEDYIRFLNDIGEDTEELEKLLFVLREAGDNEVVVPHNEPNVFAQTANFV